MQFTVLEVDEGRGAEGVPIAEGGLHGFEEATREPEEGVECYRGNVPEQGEDEGLPKDDVVLNHGPV